MLFFTRLCLVEIFGVVMNRYLLFTFTAEDEGHTYKCRSPHTEGKRDHTAKEQPLLVLDRCVRYWIDVTEVVDVLY